MVVAFGIIDFSCVIGYALPSHNSTERLFTAFRTLGRETGDFGIDPC